MGVIGLGRARGCLLGALLLLAVAVSGAPQNTAKPLDGSTDQIGVTLFLRAAGDLHYAVTAAGSPKPQAAGRPSPLPRGVEGPATRAHIYIYFRNKL